jgi:YD repeat-containing protein
LPKAEISNDKTGQLASKLNPDGQKFHYRYDSLGRLKEQFSSDASLHYSYEYDAQDNPIKVHDLIHHTVNQKKYDTLNRLTHETLNNGLTMEYTYDWLGRLTGIKLPDSSSIEYTYKGPRLYQVNRNSVDNAYTHTYEKYDLNGLPTQATLIKNAGKLQSSHDLLGRRTRQSAPHMTESLTAYDPTGNLLSRTLSVTLILMEGLCLSSLSLWSVLEEPS